MLGSRQLGVEDYKDILRRRWWILLVGLCAGAPVGYLVASHLPKKYESQTQLAIHPPSFADVVVRNDPGAYLASRLSAMQERVFSEQSLEQVVLKLGLVHGSVAPRFPESARKLARNTAGSPWEPGNIDPQVLAAIRGFRADVSLGWAQSPVSTGERDFPAFQIVCTFHHPELAQQACEEVASMFIADNTREQEKEFKSTTAFLDDELQEAKQTLDDQESRVAVFKAKHAGELPEEAQTDPGVINLLGTLETELEQAAQTQSRAEEDRTYTNSLLEMQLQAFQASMTTKSTRPAALQERLAEVENNLITLRARYTDQYPEIIKLQSQADELKKMIRDFESTNAGNGAASVGLEPPEIQQLRNQLHAYDEEIQDGALRQRQLQQRIKTYQSRLALSPEAELEYLQLTRDYRTAEDFYNDLARKKEQTLMASDLQRRRQGDEIMVVDAATFPLAPSYPNTQMFVLAGLVGGGALALGLILLLEMSDKSIQTETDVEFFLQLPVAVVVPSLEPGHSLEKPFGAWQSNAPSPRLNP